MPLEVELQRLVAPCVSDPASLSAIGMGMCWPPDSGLASDVDIEIRRGESLGEAADRLGLRWNPTWLTDAGFRVSDSHGVELRHGDKATRPGAVIWTPSPRLARVDDQTADRAGAMQRRRRVAAEVAVTALWAADLRGPLTEDTDPRPATELTGNARGARFKNFLVYALQKSLPDQWQVRPEVALTSIRGLHMRKDVGNRSSDIAVIDDGSRLVAVVSSKWTWRSDRGTEAAQMVPLKLYRPDVPYALVTAEFPRASTLARESIEDRAYHLCPTLAGAFRAIYDSASPRESWPTLSSLRSAGAAWSTTVGLHGLGHLVADLRASGTIL